MQSFQMGDQVRICHGNQQAVITLGRIVCPSDWALNFYLNTEQQSDEIDFTDPAPVSQSRMTSNYPDGSRLFVNAMLNSSGVPAIYVSIEKGNASATVERS